MQLLEEIIDGAVDGKKPVADVLRKCLVLSYQLNNDNLRLWTEKELNGFEREDEVPTYRRVNLISKGNFQSVVGYMADRPLPMSILKENHRKHMQSTDLRNPIASFESRGSEQIHDATIPWTPDLVAAYQHKFIEAWALSNAWQELPASIIVAIIDTVRNRILQFALEIKKELGLSDDPAVLSPAKVETAVTNYILGGNNIIAGTAKHFTQVGSIVVAHGNFNGLTEALKTLDIEDDHIAELKDALAG